MVISIESFKKAAIAALALGSTHFLGGCVTVQESPLPVAAPEQGVAPPAQTNPDSLYVAPGSILLDPQRTGVHQVCADIGGPTTIYYTTDKRGWRGTNYYKATVYNDTPAYAFDTTSVDVVDLVAGKFRAVAHYSLRPTSLEAHLTGIDSKQTNFTTRMPSDEEIFKATRAIAPLARADASSRNLAGPCPPAFRNMIRSVFVP